MFYGHSPNQYDKQKMNHKMIHVSRRPNHDRIVHTNKIKTIELFSVIEAYAILKQM